MIITGDKILKKILIGGQAVIEGVVMRSPRYYSIAIRRKSGDIEIKIEKFESIVSKYKILAKPFLRGIVALVETMIFGFKTLSYSAEIYSLDYEENKVEKKTPKKEKNHNFEMTISLVISFAFGIFLFVLLPLWFTNIIKSNFVSAQNHLIFNLIDGILRLIIFLLYIVVISFFKDVKRVFEYHGAEHKTVFAFENNDELSVENAKKYSTLHPRCGTNFMFIVIILSIFLISIFKVETFYLKFLLRLLILPIIASISYEIIRFLSNNFHKKWTKIFFSPGLLLQKFTTKEPDDKQLEIAIAALKSVMEKENEEASKI